MFGSSVEPQVGGWGQLLWAQQWQDKGEWL